MPNWKKVITSGSDAYLTSLSIRDYIEVPSITGSLYGTASLAISSSYSQTASFLLGSVESASYAVSASWAPGSSISYNREIHVSSGSGDDVNGNGSLSKPYKTITKAFSVVGSTGEQVIIHPGTYRESPTLNALNVTIAGNEMVNGGITFISGTLNVNSNTTGTSVRISGIAMSNLEYTGLSDLYLDGCKVYTTFNKSSNGYSEVINCGVQCSSGITVTGTGTIVFQGNKQALINVNNANAVVYVKDSLGCIQPAVTAGTFAAVDSVIYSITSGSAALVSAPNTVVQLFNTQVATPTGLPERISINGFLGYDDLWFNKNNSSLGSSIATKTHFQSADISTLTATGSLFGTSSWSSRAVTSSFATTSSFAVSSSRAVTSSYALTARSASYAPTVGLTGNIIITGSVTLVVTNGLITSYF